jgi:hypothetical protein
MSGGPSNRALILAVAALLVLATVLVAVRIFQDPQPAPSEQRPDSAAAGTPARP